MEIATYLEIPYTFPGRIGWHPYGIRGKLD